VHWTDFYFGLWSPSIGTIVLYTLILTHVTIVAVTVYLHRYSAHRALDLHPALQHFFRFWLWLTTGMTTQQWTAIHRKHHAVCETPEDPHSPRIFGLRTVLLRGAELYGVEAHKGETIERFGRGTPEDWIEYNLYQRYKRLGIALMMAIDVVLFGVIGLTVWAVQMLWIPFLAAGVVNGVGHFWGYRNFECPDAATNIVPWGILIGGEELHNNHHTYPNSAKLSVKPWEFDLGWLWIRLFTAFGLATPHNTGPVSAREPGRNRIDGNTVRAAANDRFRIMARFAERVVAPLVEQECRSATGVTPRTLRRAKNVLCRDETLLDDADRAQIRTLTERSSALRTVYELKQQLLAVWSKRGGDLDDMVAALRDWCHHAEATGIGALSDFVAELKSYTMPTRAAT
jgi:fatty-acid desaturase